MGVILGAPGPRGWVSSWGPPGLGDGCHPGGPRASGMGRVLSGSLPWATWEPESVLSGSLFGSILD
jgi:hypothetical protein